MILTLLAGCGTQSESTEPSATQAPVQNAIVPEPTDPSETQPSTQETLQTEPPSGLHFDVSHLTPPQTGEEFVATLNQVLKDHGIPVEFLLTVEADPYNSYALRSIYSAVLPGNEPSLTFDFSVYYSETSSDSPLWADVWINELAATDQEKELFPLVCAAAAVISDPNITQEQVAALMEAEASPTPYVVPSGDFEAFTSYSADYCISYVFTQPMALTHTFQRVRYYEGSAEQFYRVFYTEQDQDYFANARRAITPAPEVTVYDMEGNPVQLSDFVGKPVIFNVWATWCGFCVMELPYFHNAYLQYGDRIQFLIVNFGETGEVAQSFFQDMGYTFPIYLDPEYQLRESLQVQGIPVTLFIDAEGNILKHQEGMIQDTAFQAMIQMLLANS